MGMSEATVSTYLPYDGLIYGSEDASDHAKEVRKYREYEKAEWLEWAKGMGWKRNERARNINLL